MCVRVCCGRLRGALRLSLRCESTTPAAALTLAHCSSGCGVLDSFPRTSLPPPLCGFLGTPQPFQTVVNLIPLAESVSKLSAICAVCQEEAAFSKRLGDDLSAIVIGGADKCVPRVHAPRVPCACALLRQW